MNVLITGASRGIGRALALYFAAQKKTTQLFLVGRDEKKLHTVKQDCLAVNASLLITLLPFSLEDEKSFQDIHQQINAQSNHLDVIIHNAGHLVNKPFGNISLEELEKTYRVNVYAPYLLTQHLLPCLGGKTTSHIVNIGSMGGVQGQSKFPGLSAYSPSKMALAGLTECLAEELKGKNIAVNCLALGAVNTEMLAEAFPGYVAPLMPEEIAEYIGDFAMHGHRFYNGKILPVATSTP